MSIIDYSPSKQSCRKFAHGEIISATKNFDESLVVGRGGFGKVYKSKIDDGETIVAIKRLDITGSSQGATEFGAEITMLSSIRHCNIVSLIGYCDDHNEMILIYEFMASGTLADNIYGPAAKFFNLSWPQRVRILIEAAHGLNYLHTGVGNRERIIHRDIKSSNILLDENWTAKVSDLGISKFAPANQQHTHVTTKVIGTRGYVDPDYHKTGKLTKETDVYAFGVVLFEVLCGKPALYSNIALATAAPQWCKRGTLNKYIDPNLRGKIKHDSFIEFTKIAEQCLRVASKERPTMAEVVVALDRTLKKNQDNSKPSRTCMKMVPQLCICMSGVIFKLSCCSAPSVNLGNNAQIGISYTFTPTTTGNSDERETSSGFTPITIGIHEEKGTISSYFTPNTTGKHKEKVTTSYFTTITTGVRIRVTSIWELPEHCISNILFLTSPKEACRSSAISKKFKSIADSDALWEQFLPSGYQEILYHSDSPLPYSTKKQLYFLLSDSYILLDRATSSFTLDKWSGKKCYMVSAKNLEIVHQNTAKWSYPFHPESRFTTVAELLRVHWLDIRGRINTRKLSPETTYAAYLLYKVSSDIYGLFGCPITTLVVFPDNKERINISSIVYLKEPSGIPEFAVYRLPQSRNDGWMEIEIGEFFNKDGSDGEVEMRFIENNTRQRKSGLIVQGIEFRPKEKVTTTEINL